MGWDEMQALFAATYVEELAAAGRSGGEAALRAKLTALSDGSGGRCETLSTNFSPAEASASPLRARSSR